MRNSSRPFVAALLLGVSLAHAFGAGERTREALLARLPKFDATYSRSAREAASAKIAPPTPEDGVVILPEFKVLEKRAAQPDPEQWMTNDAVSAREVRRAEAGMNALELALNRWHIPLLMPSFAQRARANHEAKKRADELGRLTRLQNLPGGN